MKVERRVLKSISELSMFKYVLVSYLIFFILFVIIFAVAALLGWAMLATSGLTLQDLLGSFFPGVNMAGLIGGLGGGVLGTVLFVIMGLVASVFAAAMAALVAWIFNVVLKIVGGIELRFAPVKNISIEKSPLEEKYDQNIPEAKPINQ